MRTGRLRARDWAANCSGPNSFHQSCVNGNSGSTGDTETANMVNYGRLDIVVNNSGVYEYAPLEAITEEHFLALQYQCC